MIKSSVLILTILTITNCTLGIVSDPTDNTTVAAYACIAKAGYTDNTVGISSSPTAIQIDAAGLTNLNKARNSFNRVTIGFYTCRGRDPVKQVDEFVKKVPKNLYDLVWLYLGQESLWYQCSPSSYTAPQNCDYMHALINEFKKNGISVGVASDESKWKDQFQTYCGDIGTLPLYWTPTADNDPSFSKFKAFGGWQQPAVKVYQWGFKVCGVENDLTYRP